MHPLSWKELGTLVKKIGKDLINGPPTSQACLRLFGQPESSVRVILYRDHHAWCPYCQKIWLWLEEKRIPYKVRKVTMFCYGEKESWYKKICPSGMLPALELDGKLITESDHILVALEKQFGPLHAKMDDPKVRNYCLCFSLLKYYIPHALCLSSSAYVHSTLFKKFPNW